MIKLKNCVNGSDLGRCVVGLDDARVGPDRRARYDDHGPARADAGTAGRDPAHAWIDRAGVFRSSGLGEPSNGRRKFSARLPGFARRGPLIAGPWPRPPWIPRTVVIGQPAPAFGFGLLAAPMLNFSFGGGGGDGGGGGFGGGGPGMGGGGPGPGGMGPGGPAGGPPPPPDQVALMTQRLQSFYSKTARKRPTSWAGSAIPARPVLDPRLKYDSTQGRADCRRDRAGRNRRIRRRDRPGARFDLRPQGGCAPCGGDRPRTIECEGQGRTAHLVAGGAVASCAATASGADDFVTLPGISRLRRGSVRKRRRPTPSRHRLIPRRISRRQRRRPLRETPVRATARQTHATHRRPGRRPPEVRSSPGSGGPGSKQAMAGNCCVGWHSGRVRGLGPRRPPVADPGHPGYPHLNRHSRLTSFCNRASPFCL